jgi:SAM-dependent methyltransferase
MEDSDPSQETPFAHMTSDGYQYEGTDFLKLGEASLQNYNNSIATLVRRYAGDARDVLDFGAGLGSLTGRVRSLGLNPLCVELDDRHRAALQGLGFPTVATLDEVPAASVDYIYSSNVLEHIEDDVRTLVALRERLRPGGRLLLYVPAFQSLYSSLDVMAGHFRRYDRAMLASKLREATFEIEDLFYADVFGYFATRAFRRLGNNMSNANPLTLRIFDRCIFPIGCLIERLVRVSVGKNIVGVATKPQDERGV